MGYNTDFEGEFRLNKPLTKEMREYLIAFSDSRRWKRDVNTVMDEPDPLRTAVGLPLGDDAEFYVGACNTGEYTLIPGSVFCVRAAVPPATQPGLWCNWWPNQDGTAILWDGTEKFYNYIEWIEYLIEKILAPNGYSLNGIIEWQGEDEEDVGQITINNNDVHVGRGFGK